MFDPREPPTADIFDPPGIALCLNTHWASHIDGVVKQLLSRKRWVGTDEEIDAAIDQVNRFLARLGEIGDCPQMTTPIGSIIMWPNVTIPDGWLGCYGEEYLKTDYPELYAVIGDIYAWDNPPTDEDHFRVPDFQNTSPMGLGVYDLGELRGTFEETLNTSQIPAHNHGQQSSASPAYHGTGGSGRVAYGAVGTSSLARVITDDTGGGAPHNNLHPVRIINFIIYAGL